jgi:DNA-binding protein
MPKNCIYIGKKPPLAYVVALLTQFNAGQTEVIVKARGRAISTAIDVIEIGKNRFPDLKSIQVKDFKMGTEEMANPDKTTSRVSFVALTLTKG